jgi:hypothetical protein
MNEALTMTFTHITYLATEAFSSLNQRKFYYDQIMCATATAIATAGKSDSCQGSSNQQFCATATAPKGPGPGTLHFYNKKIDNESIFCSV